MNDSWSALAAVSLGGRPVTRSASRARHDQFSDVGQARRAGAVPDRREGALQLRVRSRGRSVPAGSEGRPRFRPRLLGRGDELQPSALGAAGSGRRRAGCSSGWRRQRRRARRRRPPGKERDLMESVEVLFGGSGDKLARDIAYADAMKTAAREIPGRRRDRLPLRAGAARHRRGPASSNTRNAMQAAAIAEGDLPAQPAASRRGALHHSFVRRPRPRHPRPAGRARVLEDRAVRRARAAHAVAHLRAARHVGRRRRLERRRLQGGGRSGGPQEPAARPRRLPHAVVAAVRLPAAGQVRRRAAVRGHGEGRRRQGRRARASATATRR